jgi:hypothetical protein
MYQVIRDLVREGVVPDSASVFSFALDKNVFVVNDQLQSEAFHQQFITKYNIHEMGLYYGPEKVQGHGYFFSRKLAPPGMGFPRMERSMRPIHQANLDLFFADVLDGLIAEGLLKDKTDPISFLLTNRKFVINGELQPEAIHEQLREKYISAKLGAIYPPEMAKDPDFGMHYDSKNGSYGIGIHHWKENQVP